MARTEKISRQAVLDAAVELTRTRGPEALNARALAVALGCSTQPIFRCFPSMDALRREVLTCALAEYHRFVTADCAGSPLPRYKARGMSYIRFARAEPALFRLLFMRCRDGEADSPEAVDWPADTALAGAAAGVAAAEAERFHLEMWMPVHGIAVMLATGYLALDEDTVSRMLSDIYLGIKMKWEETT